VSFLGGDEIAGSLQIGSLDDRDALSHAPTL
jgi:hypothetical protein